MPANPITPNPESDPRDRDLNLDPLTGEPGAHPVGTGVGAATAGAAGAAGAAIGAIGGPIGIAVGAAIGAVAGGLIGKGVAESVDPTGEDAYWRERHSGDADRPYETYSSAYRVGYSGYRDGKTFEESEEGLRTEYERSVGTPGTAPSPEAESTPGTKQNKVTSDPLRWDDAREAARAAYERVRLGEAKAPRDRAVE